MKIDIISDTHIDSWQKLYKDLDSVDFFKPSGKSNICLFAGDSGNGPTSYVEIVEALSYYYDKVVAIPGNHEHYGAVRHSDISGHIVEEIDGIKIAGATLWTDFRGSLESELIANRCISDFRAIQGFSTEECKRLHDAAKEFLQEHCDADIFLTHFGPFRASDHPDYAEKSYLDPYFNNSLENWVKNLQSKPKLWVHGHSHKKIDYMHEDIRVVCNPIGYINEEQKDPIFIPLTVEL